MLLVVVARLARMTARCHHLETLGTPRIGGIVVGDNLVWELMKQQVEVHDVTLKNQVLEAYITILLKQVDIAILGPTTLAREVG